MNTPGQITFGGEVITGIRLAIAPLTLEVLPQGITWEDVAALAKHDRLLLQFEAVVTEAPRSPSKFDRETGDEVGPPVGVISLMPVRQGAQVLGVQKAADRANAWREDHGASA